jgi:hypothetical protein
MYRLNGRELCSRGNENGLLVTRAGQVRFFQRGMLWAVVDDSDHSISRNQKNHQRPE